MAGADTHIYLLVGDIGGTNSRLQLFTSSAVPPTFESLQLHTSRVYDSRAFSSLDSLVLTFLSDAHIPVPLPAHGGITIHACALGVCGPVAGETYMSGPVLPEQKPTTWKAHTENLLTGPLGTVIQRAVLLNDFIAVGLGLTALDKQHIVTLHEGKREDKAPMACVGAGTGLGEVYLTYEHTAGYYRAWPSEGGMTEFHAHDEEEWQLRQFLQRRDGHVTVEGVVSGPGLANVYQFLQETQGAPEIDTQGRALQKVVGENALSAHPDPFCLKAVDMMLRAWGAECRQVALRVIPYGGLFLAGGITPKLLPRMKEVIEKSFLDDSVMGEFLAGFPVYAVTDESVGLLGARVRAFRLLSE